MPDMNETVEVDIIDEPKEEKLKYSLVLSDDGDDCGLVLTKGMDLSIFLPINYKEKQDSGIPIPENVQFIATLYNLLSNEDTKQELVDVIINLASRTTPKIG